MTVQCCKCKKLRHEHGWSYGQLSHTDIVSHTYCPVCLEDSLADLQAERSGERVEGISGLSIQ